jgi:hypothetical protein
MLRPGACSNLSQGQNDHSFTETVSILEIRESSGFIASNGIDFGRLGVKLLGHDGSVLIGIGRFGLSSNSIPTKTSGG